VSYQDSAALAHDLKTPITVIVGYAELLAIRDDEETRTRAVEQILAAAQRLSAAVDEWLGEDAPARHETERAEPRRAVEARRVNGGRARVLLVDDDVFVRRLLRMTLPTTDFALVEASDGDAALVLIDAHRPDVIVLDWHMPTLSGDEVLPRLKERHPDLPVVVLTAAGEERSRAGALGADAFLAKPFSPRELLETIGVLVADDSSRPERKAPKAG